ncbi:hypothetical protein FRB95_014122 [Tulasnella sp. JGI-2019a]|nr:hypothetical protein FRB95_014122 [Tulasnella sp. JGI-2019a]
MYKEIARTKKDEGQDDNACTSLNDAATIYKELGDLNSVADCLKSIAQIKEDQEEYDDACTSLNDAATIYKELRDLNSVADCLKSIAQIKEDQEEYDDACTSLNDAATIYKELRDLNSVADCLKSIAQIKEDQEEYDDACTSLNDAATIYKELEDRNSAVDCLKSIANIKEAQEEYDDACTWLNNAATIYKELGDRNSAIECLESIVQIKKAQEEYDDTCTSLNDALTIYKELGDREGLADFLESIAQIKRVQKEYEDACALLNDAVTIYKGLNNPGGMALCLKAIGETRKLQGRHSDGFISLREAWVIAKESYFLIYLQLEIVQAVEVLLDDWRQSNDLIPERGGQNELPEVFNEICGMVDSLLCVGKASCKRDRWHEAIEPFGDAYRLLKGLEDGWGLVECLRSLAATLGKQGDPVKHIQCLLRLAGALEPINVPWPSEPEATGEGYMLVLKAGQLLERLGGVSVPEGLRIEVAQLHVRVAIAFHARLRPKEARSTLLDAGRFLQQPAEELQVTENLTRLEGVLLQADCIRESVVVSEELRRVQLELHERMPLNE